MECMSFQVNKLSHLTLIDIPTTLQWSTNKGVMFRNDPETSETQAEIKFWGSNIHTPRIFRKFINKGFQNFGGFDWGGLGACLAAPLVVSVSRRTGPGFFFVSYLNRLGYGTWCLSPQEIVNRLWSSQEVGCRSGRGYGRYPEHETLDV